MVANALEVPIGSATHENANILVFDGSQARMQTISENYDEWAGLAIYANYENQRMIYTRSGYKTVYRFHGYAQTFVTTGRGANGTRALTVHELGHALGYVGHTPNPTDVMFYRLQWGADGTLSQDEITHLRQIYRIFR